MAKKGTDHSRDSNNPFKTLKGFVVSQEVALPRNKEAPSSAPPEDDHSIDFTDKMARLGVRPMAQDREGSAGQPEASESTEQKIVDNSTVSEQEIFLEAMETLNVHFEDHLPDIETEQPLKPISRRLKRLRKGDLVPAATLDLHGVLRREVETKMRHFLQNARYHGQEVVLVITGKGLHSQQGEPVIRQAVEEFLQQEATAQVAEWGRAPRQYGGEGALVLFLRKP